MAQILRNRLFDHRRHIFDFGKGRRIDRGLVSGRDQHLPWQEKASVARIIMDDTDSGHYQRPYGSDHARDTLSALVVGGGKTDISACGLRRIIDTAHPVLDKGAGMARKL